MSTPPLNLGLLGGTFDPIHCGHLDVAREAQRALGLDAIWVIPARRPPHRTNPHASAAHRFAMAALGVADEPHLLMSDLEMDATGPSYTMGTLDRIETLGALGALGMKPSRIAFLIGADAFRDIRTWRGYPAVLDRCHFAVVSRPGCPVSGLRSALPELQARMTDAAGRLPETPAVLLIDASTTDVSSTMIRQAVVEGRDLAGLTPAPVARYILRHSLYSPSRSEPRSPGVA